MDLIKRNTNTDYSDKIKSPRVTNNFERIKSALKNYRGAYYALPDENELNSILIKCSVHSNFLCDIIVRNPEFLQYYLSSEFRQKENRITYYKYITNQTFEIFKTVEKRKSYLRRIKRREMLCIALDDILGINNFRKTSEYYSALAEALISSALKISIEKNLQRFSLKKIPCKYSLVSLGKLGGCELNYSSDVDLIFFYEKDGKIKSSIYSNEFFENVITDFIQICSEVNQDGYLFRTDFRLRPEGKNSVLSRTADNMLFYYETRGQAWERQMLLKARFCAGDYGLFKYFKERIDRFIFPKTFLESPEKLIERYKVFYEKQREDDNNIKFSDGGIRDIEFIVQILQLIYGNMFNELKTTGTLETLDIIEKLKLINEEQLRKLRESYIFLRKAENYVQLMDDRQIYSLPANEELMYAMAVYFGCKSEKEFLLKYKHSKTVVNKIYSDILGKKRHTDEIFKKINFTNKEKAINTITRFQEKFSTESGTFHLMQKSAEISSILKMVLNYLAKIMNPDKTLENFDKFLSEFNYSAFMIEFLRDKIILNNILKLCDTGESLINEISINKNLKDFIISGAVFIIKEMPIKPEIYDKNELELLRFYSSLNFLLQRLSITKANSILSQFYSEAIKIKAFEVNKEFKLNPEKIGIYALGSLGTGEININSDIDILFVFDSDKYTPVIKYQNFFTNLLTKLHNDFPNTEIDCRLRPEGKSSQLAWDIKEFSNYIDKRAKIWEMQSYTKLLPVYAGEEISRIFTEKIKQKVRTYTIERLSEEIKINRNKLKSSVILPSDQSIDLKNSYGGITDIQFLMQFIELIKAGWGKKIIPTEIFAELKKLKTNYIKLRQLSLFLYIYLRRKRPIIKAEEKDEPNIKKFLGLKDNLNIIDFVNSLLSENNRIINHINKLITENVYKNS